MQKSSEKHLKILSTKLMQSMFQGGFKNVFHGRGLEFQDFRQYSHTDDSKYIDWAVSSREGTTIMRRYKEEKQGNILCLLDISDSFHIGNEKKRILSEDIISLLGNASYASGDSFGGYIFSQENTVYIPSRTLKTNIATFLHHTQQNGEQAHPDFSVLLKKGQKTGVVFCITDRNKIDIEQYKLLSLKHDVIMIHISTYFENTLEGEGVVELRDNTGKISINLSDIGRKKTYIEMRKKQIHSLEKELHKYGISFMSVDERSNLYVKFLYLIRQRQGKR